MLRRLVKRLSILLLVTSLSPLAGCGGDEGDDGVTPTTPDAGGNTGCDLTAAPEYKYVVSAVTVPTTANQAAQIALDIDNWAEDSEPGDNALGQVLSTLNDQVQGLNIPTAVDEQIRLGSVVVLINLKSDDLTQTNCASAGVYLGSSDPANITPAPCADANDTECGKHLTGSGMFSLDPTSPTDSSVTGNILNSRFFMEDSDEPGSFSIELGLDSGITLPISLVGARLEISGVQENGLMTGRLGGAITETDLETELLPALQSILNNLIAECPDMADPPACCPADSPGGIVVDFFDVLQQDCNISIEEITENGLISGLLAPDVDLFNGDSFAPNADGELDSLSLGIEFSAVPAEFTLP